MPPCIFSKLATVTIHLEFIKTQLCLKRNILRHFNCTVFNSPANNKSERGKNEARANILKFVTKKNFINPLANTKSRNYRINSPKEFRFDNTYSLFSALGLLLIFQYILNHKYVNISN